MYIPTDTDCSELNPGMCGGKMQPTMLDNCDTMYFEGVDDVTLNQGVGIDLADGVTAYDSTGVEIPFEYEPTEIDKCSVGEHEVIYKAIGADERLLPSICGENFLSMACSGIGTLIAKRLVTIEQADPPTINGIDDVELDVGEPFNPMDGVTGVDDNGNPLDVLYYGEYDDYAEGDIASFETDLMHPFRSLKVNIDPVQDLHGYDAPWVGGAGKNKLPDTRSQGDTTISGVTFTTNSDGSVTMNGTATSTIYYNMIYRTSPFVLPQGQYIVSGLTGSSAFIVIGDAATNIAIGNTNNMQTFTVSEATNAFVFIQIPNGTTLNNITAYPMIRLATETDATYEPYENICPITGWTGCEVSQAGVNLFDADRLLDAFGWTESDGVYTGDSDRIAGNRGGLQYLFKFDIPVSGQFTLSFDVTTDKTYRAGYMYFGYSDGTNSYTEVNTSVWKHYSMVSTSGKSVSKVYFGGSNATNMSIKNIMLEFSSTETTYTPYNGTTYPVSWQPEAGTVYGGTVDIVSGVLTVDGAKDTYDEQASISMDSDLGGYHRFYISNNNIKKYTDYRTHMVTNLCPIVNNYASYGGFDGELAVTAYSIMSNTSNWVYIISKTISSVADLKTFLSSNPLEVYYELATPQTYQLSPTTIQTLLGRNNVWADCGDVYVEYSKTIPSSGNITYPLDGIYSIIYSATDQCGNVGTVIRNIIVGDFSTILFADGTLVFNVLPQDMASYVAEHGSISKTYPALYGENDYVFNNSSDVYWYSEMASIISVEFSMPIHPTSMAHWFRSATNLVSFDPTNLDTSNVTDMTHTFSKCQSLVTLDVTSFDTSNVVTFDCTFLDCKSLTTLDVSGFDTSNATRLSSMFQNCESLTTLDVSGFDTSKNTSLYHTFGHCESVTALDVSGFDTSNTTDMQGTFEYCKLVTTLDVSGFDTSNVLLMSSMFRECESLTSIDVTGFDTRKVTKMWSMFESCLSLPSLDVTHFDTSNVNDMHNMFRRCKLLTSLDVSNFDTRKVTDMGYMFASMDALTTLDLSNFDTGSVTNMSYMFSYTYALASLNISSFDTSNVTTMESMFHTCALTTINICSFDTSSVTIMKGMFEYADCVTINVSEDFVVTQVIDSTKMFFHCNDIVGGDGTVYDSDYIDKIRAKIDGGVGDEGYFTECTGAIVGLAYVDISSI